MADKDYKAFIVEGEAREPLIIDNITRIFFSHGQIKIITLPAGQNIYMLWKKLKEDDFDTDIIEVLREENNELKKQLEGLSRDDFSEVYLVFDYDGHQNNLGNTEDGDVVDQMLSSFDNETENGKLYISYPMVEALRDFDNKECGNGEDCFVTISELTSYKGLSATRSIYSQLGQYDFQVWEEAIDAFVRKISCLFNQVDTLTYEKYIADINPYEIKCKEQKEIDKNRIFILSAFPELLLDYFGIKLWRRCVKHNINKYNNCLSNGIR